jgi:hypothetical protein
MARDEESNEAESGLDSDAGREEAVEADEIDAAEEGFSAGYFSTDREEEDTASDAYDQAFASKAKPKKRARKDDDEDEEELEDE